MSSGGSSTTADSLRRRAEALLTSTGTTRDEDVANATLLVHELAVHHAELELQNDDLREAQTALQEARDRFAALYEHAPVGYVVLDASGIVLQANGTWRTMLNRADDDLRRRDLGILADRQALEGDQPDEEDDHAQHVQNG